MSDNHREPKAAGVRPSSGSAGVDAIVQRFAHLYDYLDELRRADI